MTDIYIYMIILLLPLTAAMVVFQVNPYYALIMRGILGSVAATVYAILGAADVALTEALVGTLLAITLYAIAARSSMVMRVGVLKDDFFDLENSNGDKKVQPFFDRLIINLRKVFNKYHMRVELISYQNTKDLEQAFMDKDIHTTCISRSQFEPDDDNKIETKTRIKRLYKIMKNELPSSGTLLTYFDETNLEEKPSLGLQGVTK